MRKEVQQDQVDSPLMPFVAGFSSFAGVVVFVLVDEGANCQEGMPLGREARPGKGEGEAAADRGGSSPLADGEIVPDGAEGAGAVAAARRESKMDLSDFSSCWRSPSDDACDSCCFSTICALDLGYRVLVEGVGGTHFWQQIPNRLDLLPTPIDQFFPLPLCRSQFLNRLLQIRQSTIDLLILFG